MNLSQIRKELEEIRSVSLLNADRATGIIKILDGVSTPVKSSKKKMSPDVAGVVNDRINKMYNPKN